METPLARCQGRVPGRRGIEVECSRVYHRLVAETQQEVSLVRPRPSFRYRPSASDFSSPPSFRFRNDIRRTVASGIPSPVTASRTRPEIIAPWGSARLAASVDTVAGASTGAALSGGSATAGVCAVTSISGAAGGVSRSAAEERRTLRREGSANDDPSQPALAEPVAHQARICHSLP